MVKPPSSMRPEAVDLAKAGRAATKPFQESGFHNYIARKIHLQRCQFGLVLPPPSPAASPSPPAISRPAGRRKSSEAIKKPPLPAAAVTLSTPSLKARDKAREARSLTEVSGRRSSEGKESSAEKRQKIEPSKKQRVSFSLDVSGLPDLHGGAGAEGEGLSGILHRLKRSHGEISASDPSQSSSPSPSPSARNQGILEASESCGHGNFVRGGDDLMSSAACGAPDELASTVAGASSIDQKDQPSPQPRRQKEMENRAHSKQSADPNAPPPKSSPRSDVRASSGGRPDLFFRGVVVLINGYTEPDAATLQRWLHRHGGDVEKYETDRVTAVIASELSHAKASVYRNLTKKPIPVVRPGWIVDSVRHRRLLPYQKYVLGQLRTNRHGGSVESMLPFVAPSAAASHAAVTTATVATSVSTPSVANENCSTPTRHVHFLDSDRPSDQALRGGLESRSSVRSHTDDAGSSPIDRAESVQLAQTQDSTHDDEDVAAGQMEEMPSPSRPNIERDASPPQEFSKQPLVPARRTDEKYIDGRVRIVGTDPHFLDTFFSKSRLSFIGSFRQRARTSPSKAPRSNESLRSERWVLHVDIDSFFASVVLRDYPQYRDSPVVISHQANQAGLQHNPSRSSTSECATCNYKAREVGIQKGMFLGRAQELCRVAGLQLVVLPYNFEAYEDVKEKVADILYRYGAELDGRVNQVSCDESYMELHLPVGPDPSASAAADAERLAQSIRREIVDATDCTASIGVAKNMFLAKLGTDSVKPDGCCVVRDHRELLAPLKLRQLPGIGHHLEKKLDEDGLSTVQDVWDLGDESLAVLESRLGAATGRKIHNFCHGRDDRPVVAGERKSIGAECSYGVRFNGDYGPDYMIACLATEVSKRMAAVGVRGGAKVTLKVKKRKADAPLPHKFLGCGYCDSLSKSSDVPGLTPTRDASLLSKLCWTLYRQLEVPKEDVRGMGIVVTKLSLNGDCRSALTDGNGKQPFIRSWLNPGDIASKERSARAQDFSDEVVELSSEMANSAIDGLPEDCESQDKTVDPGFELPALNQIRMSQVECLPSPMKRFVMSKIEVSRAQERWEAEHMLLQPKRSRKTSSGVTFDPKLVTSRKRSKIEGGNFAPRTSTLKRNGPSLSRDPVAVESATPTSLFDEDVYPLSLFMDEHPTADSEARDRVSAFLLTCAKERRLYDLVVLLRSIKNRSDHWSSRHVFESILDQVNEAVHALEGSRLDSKGI